MSMFIYVCLSVCLSVREHISQITCQNFTKFSMLLRVAAFQCCFVDDVRFFHNELYVGGNTSIGCNGRVTNKQPRT